MKLALKYLVRSRSLGYTLARTARIDGSESILRYNGHRLHYRTGTSDHYTIYEILLKGRRAAYASRHLPAAHRDMVIVDAGANIGASVVFFKQRYPDASIYAFEPVPGNFAMLRKNAGDLPGVKLFNEALGDRDGELELIHSPQESNEGGWGIRQPLDEATGAEERIAVPLFVSGKRLRDLGVERIDILKVDTEGSESAIIAGL